MTKRLLLLSECPLLPLSVLSAAGWQIVKADSPTQAKRILSQTPCTLAAVQIDQKTSPLAKALQELCVLHEMSGLCIVPGEKLDTISYQLARAPIMVLPLQTPRHVFTQVLDYLGKEAEHNAWLAGQLAKEKKKAQDEKLVTQAKLSLISHCRWSEEKAHSYIQKLAMDHSLTKAAAARLVLRKVEGILHEKQKNQCHASS